MVFCFVGTLLTVENLPIVLQELGVVTRPGSRSGSAHRSERSDSNEGSVNSTGGNSIGEGEIRMIATDVEDTSTGKTELEEWVHK